MFRIHKQVYNHRCSWNLLLECTCQMDTVDRILGDRYFDRSLWDRMCTVFAFLPRMFRLDSALKRENKRIVTFDIRISCFDTIVRYLLTTSWNIVGIHVQNFANTASEASSDGRLQSSERRALIANGGYV